MSTTSTRAADPPARSGRSGTWWLPAGTFLAGCVLGGVVMGVGDVGGDDGAPDDGPVAVAGAADADGAAGEETAGGGQDDSTGDSAAAVRVPESCARTAEDVSALVEQVDDVVAAVAGLDPERLRQAVDDVQQVRDEVQGTAERCQEAAARGRVEVGDAEDEPEEDAVAPSPAS